MSESIDWTQPAETILDQLLETVERRIPADKSRDDTAWVQLNRIAHVFDSSTLKEMKQSLVRNGYEDFYQILIGGDDFGKPKVQAILDALGQIDPAVFTPSRVQTMKSWGVDRRPRWTLEGFASQPSVDAIEQRKATEAESVHRQKAKVAGVRFGDQMPIDGDAGEVMSQIWESM
jgi:hypothetical protein